MRAVVDTNVIVAAACTPTGACSTLLQSVFSGEIELVTADLLLDEYRSVLLRPRIAARHGKSESDVHELVDLIGELSKRVNLSEYIPRFVRDIDDDIFIACAIAGNADIIVSGDIHLLEHGSFGKVHVLRPHEALALLVD
ncbi:MAG: putative toxin-antitoxin system toxin component, PIN family [Thermomicrobiales bacterium]|nr:putative toxin-antitoxin system toxin component, PIN family [Thermomicrobiales bacterium]